MKYLAAIKVYGDSTVWILSHLDGETDEERAIEIHSYLKDMGVRFYTVIHYEPMRVHSIALEDIYLN